MSIMKGYQINLGKIEDGFLYSPVTCVAESLNKAKSILIKKVRYDGMKRRFSDNDINYTTIPVIRYPEGDIKEFEGKYITQREIDEELAKRKREEYFKSILNDDNTTHCYIRKHGSFYRPNVCGYTSFRSFAGIYEKNDAVQHGRSCSELQIIPINNEEHNKCLQDDIDDMKSRIISEPVINEPVIKDEISDHNAWI